MGPLLLFWLGFAGLALPTAYDNYKQSWSTEQGAHAPIVIAIGVWLLWRAWPAMRRAAIPGRPAVAGAFAAAPALLYLFGTISDQYLLQSYSLYGFGLVAVYALVGLPGIRKGWFPLAYLSFGLPLPYTVIWALTSHLRLWITQSVVTVLHLFGMSIVRDGLNILVDQYELAVQEACSGMNSLVSLSAIGLVYIYIRRQPPLWYFAVMALPIIGFAIFGNFVRVVVLVLLTHFYGDAVAQSYLHETAGLVTFVSALLGVMALDAFLSVVWLDRKGARA